MSNVLHIVASCAQTKAVVVPRALQLRSVPRVAAKARVQLWAKQRDAAHAAAGPAQGLYSGTYWANVRRLVDRAAGVGYSVKLWIASAGYGLVAGDEPVKPYSATFAPYSKDSVCAEGLSRELRIHHWREWWEGLARHRRETQHPRSVAELARRNGGASLLVLAGPAYVQAMRDDLYAGAGILEERFVLVTSSEEHLAVGFDRNVIPSEARWVGKVGGALPTLHARVAEHIIAKSRGRALDSGKLRDYALGVLSKQPAWEMPQREKMSDHQVVAFIRRKLRRDQSATHTRLLRELRSSGQACEQKRFKQLFHSLVETRHVS